MPNEAAPVRTRTMMIKNLHPQLAERGKIKIGRKGHTVTSRQGNQFQPPEKLDHFVVTTMDRDQTGNFVRDEAAHKILGDKPRRIPVRLLFDDIGLNFASRYACYQGRKLWCHGDGESAQRLSGDGEARTEVACPCERIQADYAGKDKCKFNGNLSVLIDKLPGVGGVWKFRTTSYNSVVNIMSSMGLIKSKAGGALANLPLDLVLNQKSVADPKTGNQQIVYVVSVEYPGTMAELRKEGLGILRENLEHHISVQTIEAEIRSKLALPAPTSVGVFDDETEEDVADEFYPPEGQRQISAPTPTTTSPDPLLAGITQTAAEEGRGEDPGHETPPSTGAQTEDPPAASTTPSDPSDIPPRLDRRDDKSADLNTSRPADSPESQSSGPPPAKGSPGTLSIPTKGRSLADWIDELQGRLTIADDPFALWDANLDAFNKLMQTKGLTDAQKGHLAALKDHAEACIDAANPNPMEAG